MEKSLPPIALNPPKTKIPLNFSSIHPFMWAALEFIKKVPLDEIHDEKIRDEWKDFQGCAIQAMETAMDFSQKIFKPEPVLGVRIRCLNQRIEKIIDPAPIEK